MSQVKLLFYAINGTGMGHLTRLLAVARSVRDILGGLDIAFDIRFLTSSEASDLAWDFPVYKLPSKTVAREVGLEPAGFEGSCKLLVGNLLASFSPDILVVDTLPQGSYREISFIRDYVKRMVYIDRHKDLSLVSNPLFQKHVALYDLILVPDYESQADRYLHPPECLERRKFVGPIHGYCPSTALQRGEVRDLYGVEPGQRLIYLSGGGGSDSRDFLAEVALRLSQDPDNFVLVGWGPLHRGKCPYRPNLIPLFRADARDYFPGIDAAISAAGYNSYQELLAAGVPTVFYPQPKGMDRQDERVQQGVREGWHLMLSQQDPVLACQALSKLFEEDVREALLKSLHNRTAPRGTLLAAAELLSLHSCLPTSPVNRPKLFQVCGWRAIWPSEKRALFPQVAVTARRWLKHMCSPESLEIQSENALLDWHNGRSGQDRELLLWAERLEGLENDLRSELIRAWSHKCSCSPRQEALMREQAGETLDVLAERWPEEWTAVLSEFLECFKRPYQRRALRDFTLLLDSDEDDSMALAALRHLRQQPRPWAQRELQSLKGDGAEFGTREVVI